MTTIVAAPFNWNAVIDNIVSLQNTGALLNSGIRILNSTPDAADEGQLPATFPMDDPAGMINSWTKMTMPNHVNHIFRSKADYTLHWIYLHVEIPQGITNFKKAPYRPEIRLAIANIFALITSNTTRLGVEFVKPQLGSFDFNLTSPSTGRRYLGATYSIQIFEFADQIASA